MQRAVSNCLPPLMGPLSANKEAVDGLVAGLLSTLTKGRTFGERWVRGTMSRVECSPCSIERPQVRQMRLPPPSASPGVAPRSAWRARSGVLGSSCLLLGPCPPGTVRHQGCRGPHAPVPSPSSSGRRGAAFGLAGVVKGLGLMSMKNCGIMDALKVAVEDKKDPAAREVRAAGW